MSDSPLLGLPYLAAAQAQKHVTHNEALSIIDGLIHLSVLSRALAVPPATPADGDRYVVASAPSGDWSGHAGELALRMEGAWRFLTPRPGWRLWVEDEAKLLVRTATAWLDITSPAVLQNMEMLGINATADSTNRLALASAASLFNHAGAGHQVKINKNAVGDTASFLFQTGFSGRAEFGTTGDDDFHLKVSADGSAWTDALTVDAASGLVNFPQGVSGFSYAPGWAERRLAAVQPLANSNAMQDWFTSNGGLPLVADSTYEFNALFFSLNGSTSHGLNMQFAAMPGATILWDALGSKITATANATAFRRTTTNTFDTARNVTTSSTVAGNAVTLSGTVITGPSGGTLRPQVAQTAASGDFSVQPGTFFRARRIGSSSFSNSGEWTT